MGLLGSSRSRVRRRLHRPVNFLETQIHHAALHPEAHRLGEIAAVALSSPIVSVALGVIRAPLLRSLMAGPGLSLHSGAPRSPTPLAAVDLPTEARDAEGEEPPAFPATLLDLG